MKYRMYVDEVGNAELADLIAHSYSDDILNENGLLGKAMRPFSDQVIRILQGKYNQLGGRVTGIGKKFI